MDRGKRRKTLKTNTLIPVIQHDSCSCFIVWCHITEHWSVECIKRNVIAKKRKLNVGSIQVNSHSTRLPLLPCPRPHGRRLNPNKVYTASGGISPYFFSEDGGTSYQTFTNPHTFAGLAAGTYSIRVKDSNNCEAAAQSVEVTQPTVVSFTSSGTCSSGTDGQLSLFPSGGSGTGYEYSVNSGAFSAANPITDLAVGSYSLVAKDSTGCLSNTQKASILSCIPPHCALSHGYWKNQGASLSQTFSTQLWCGQSFWFWLTTNGKGVSNEIKIKVNAGRQYVAFFLTMYYYSTPNVDIRGWTAAQIEAKGVPHAVAQAFYDLDRDTCNLDSSWYAARGTELDHFNSHSDFYPENVECTHIGSQARGAAVPARLIKHIKK